MLSYKNGTESLTKEKVIEVTDDKQVYYGGSQKWFASKTLQRTGCSIVAAANLIAYKAYTERNEKIFRYEDKSKENFLSLMNELSSYLVPDETFGVISTLYFVDKVKEYLKDRNVNSKADWITTEYSFEEFERFIVRAVKKDKPVILLMMKNAKLKKFDWHWMTITKIFKFNDIIYIYISTWGEKRVLRLYDLYLYCYYGSLICF